MVALWGNDGAFARAGDDNGLVTCDRDEGHGDDDDDDDDCDFDDEGDDDGS